MAHIPDWIRTQPIAHRGLHDAVIPENSLAAFQAAVDAGYAIELDVHLSRDNTLIVSHDAKTGRLTRRDLIIGQTAAAELTALRLGDTRQRIPSFDQVLQLVAGAVPILIEIKTGYAPARMGRELQALLATYNGPYAVQSFDPRYLMWYAKNAPAVPRGQLAAGFRGDPAMSRLRKFALRNMLMNPLSRPHFLAYAIADVAASSVPLWRRMLGAPLLLWTVTTEAHVKQAQRLDANIIFESIRP